MKRTLIIMMALGMVIAFATPAAAKKGGGGGNRGQQTYTITMELVEEEAGLATTCSESISMTGSLDNVLSAPNAGLEMSGVDGLQDGCHSGTLWLTFRHGGTVEVKWRFDAIWNGSALASVYELDGVLALDGDVLTGATATGDVTISRFERIRKNVGAWSDVATDVPITFILTIGQ